MNIGIRAGHWGATTTGKGTSGNGLIEKNMNLDVSKKLKSKLETKYGFDVYMKHGDLGKSLYDYYNKYCGVEDLVFPIHHNGYYASSNGSEVLLSIYAKEKAKKHAQMLLNLFVKSFNTKSRGLVQKKSTKTGKDYYAIIRNLKAKVILGEPIFITNKKEADYVKKDYNKFIDNEVTCYEKVACSWYGIKYKNDVTTTTNTDIETLKGQNKQIILKVDDLLKRIQVIENTNLNLDKKQHELADLIIEIQEKIKHIETPENYNEVLKLIKWLKNYEN